MPYIKLTGESEDTRKMVQDRLYEMGYRWHNNKKYNYLNCNYLEYYKRDGKLQLMAHFCSSKPEYFTAKEFLEMTDTNIITQIDVSNSSQEERKAVQDKLFEMGYTWTAGQKYQYLDARYIHFYPGCKSLAFSEKKMYGAEISAKDFLGVSMTVLQRLIAGQKVQIDSWPTVYLKIKDGKIYSCNDIKGTENLFDSSAGYLNRTDCHEYKGLTLKMADKTKKYKGVYNRYTYAYIPVMETWVCIDGDHIAYPTNMDVVIEEVGLV